MRFSPRDLLEKYGPLAIVIYFVIFFATWVGFYWAIRTGWRPQSATSVAGTWGAAYLATKLTQPLRIAATVAVTPLVVAIRDRMTRRPRPADVTEVAGSRSPDESSSPIVPRAD
jgi:hypothetical protein